MSRLTSLVVGTGFALLIVVAACSSPSSGSGSGSFGASAPIPLEQLPAQYAARICDSLGPCCQANGTAYDSAACRQTAQADLTANIAKLNKPTVQYDASAAGACIDAYVTTIRACSQNETETQALLSACDAVFTGTLPNGAPCTVSNECAKSAGGEAYCDMPTVVSTGSGGGSGAGGSGATAGGGSSGSSGSSGATGTCVQDVPSPHGKAGDACIGDCTATAIGSSCSSSGTAGAGVTVTALCYHNEGLYCATTTTTATRVCTPIAAIGSPCSSGGCVAGAFCNAGTCAAQYASGPCGANAYDACSSASYCDYTSGQCVPKLADGAVCTGTTSCQSDHCQYPSDSSSSSSGGGTSPPAIGGSGGAPAVPQGVCAKQTFATAKTCMGQLDD